MKYLKKFICLFSVFLTIGLSTFSPVINSQNTLLEIYDSTEPGQNNSGNH